MTTADKLSTARAAFESWRTERSGKTKIPDKLWSMAVALLDDYAIAHVARELRLNQTQLRHQQLAGQPSAPIKAQIKAHTAFLEVPQFVHVGNNASAVDSATLQLRIERVDGHRLTLSLSSSQADMLQSLVTAFMRA